MTYTALSRTPDALPADLIDVRGWDLRSDAGERLGRVADAILQDGARVRWLEVEAGGFFNPRRVLLPIEHAAPDEAHRVVRLVGIGRQQFKNLPEYSGRPEEIGWLLENLIQRACASPDEVPAHHDREMPDESHDPAPARPRAAESQRGRGAFADEERALARPDTRADAAAPAARGEQALVDRQLVQSGEMGVRTSVDTERVRVPVKRMREDIVVERRPVTGMSAEHARPIVTDDEIRIPLIEEEIVVTRRQVVREEIVIRKRAIEETTEVEAELRRERVDIQPRGGARISGAEEAGVDTGAY